RFQPRALPGMHGQTILGLVLPMQILIVDDSLDNRLLLQTLLKSAGYGDVLTAASAREDLRRLGVEEGEPVACRRVGEGPAGGWERPPCQSTACRASARSARPGRVGGTTRATGSQSRRTSRTCQKPCSVTAGANPA